MRLPSAALRAAADARARTTLDQQERSLAAISLGRPLDAEDHQDRKLAVVSRRVGVPPDVASAILAGVPPVELPLGPGQQAEAARVQGKSADVVPVGFLIAGVRAAGAVVRIATPGREALGTGCLVGPGVLLTTCHVLRTFGEATAAYAEFGFDTDASVAAGRVSRYALAPDRLYLTDAVADLDFALVALGRHVDGPDVAAAVAPLPLYAARDEHAKGLPVNLIQHPDGRPKEVVLRAHRILARTAEAILYGADTLPDSSGSPVFNDDWEIIAVHHWGTPHRAVVDQATGLPMAGNAGVRIGPILDAVRRQAPGLSAAEQALLAPVLAPPPRPPSLAAGGTATPEGCVPASVSTRADGDPPPLAPPRQPAAHPHA